MAEAWRGWTIAGAASLLWLLMTIGYAISVPPASALGWMIVLVAGLVPVTMIWLIAVLFKQTEDLAEDVRYLMDRVAKGREAREDLAILGQLRQDMERGFRDLRAQITATDEALTALRREGDGAQTELFAHPTAEATVPDPKSAPAREVEPERPVATEPTLPLSAPPDTPPSGSRDWGLILRALNFPEDEEDLAGFKALREATRDRAVAGLLRAAEDVLNLLAQDGIYMDDLVPHATEPEHWRRFAAGERGAALEPLAGIEDASALDTTRTRMRRDEVMRDAALHFMRRFDGLLKDLVAEGDADPTLRRLPATRSGRAFMLIAQVTGALD
ncbi:MAG: hypothetical protein AAFU59_04410 [Pseudomonadota bacterium]